MKNYIVISILLVICTIANAQTPTGFPKPKFKQPGVYVTYQDFVDDKPILGKKLSQTSGKGEGEWVLEMNDGSQKKFKAGTIWGCLKPCWDELQKKFGATDYHTPCRIFEGDKYPIYMYGAVFIYSAGNYIPSGDSFLFIGGGGDCISVGADGAIISLTSYFGTTVRIGGMSYSTEQIHYEKVIALLNQDVWSKVQKYRGYTLTNLGPYTLKMIRQEYHEPDWKKKAGNTYYAAVYSEEKEHGKTSSKERKLNSMLSVPLFEYYNNILAGTPLKPLNTLYAFELAYGNYGAGSFTPEHFDRIVPNQPKE